MSSLRQETVALLRRFNLKVRRDLGQNFLVDDAALDAAIDAAELSPDDIVLEVGPGLGILTKELALRCRRLIAVEVDPQMVAVLNDLLAGFRNVSIIQKDILWTEPRALVAEALSVPIERVSSGAYKVVANLPYYITSPTLRHFLEAEAKPSLMVLTLQKEVAERITAKPGKMSLLAVSVQLYGQPRIMTIVPASSFFPQPKVDSAVVRIDVYERPAVDVDDLDAFFTVVQAGFSQPRKQLHNAIPQRLWLPAGKIDDLLQEAGIDPQRRAGTLSLEEWARLYRAIKRFREGNV